MSLLLGCIADDFTGGTDLAGMLVKAGMRTVQMIGVPNGPIAVEIGAEVDAIVIALKSRTAAPEEAVRESLAALYWLQQAGARQFYFKYCSTFDSTPQGNIGPVAEALMGALGCDLTIACPAFPANARTVYKGHLFVGDVLLSDSGMRHHPLTPMNDANLVHVLQAQVKGKVGLADHAVVQCGSKALGARFKALLAEGCNFAVVDALSNDDLLTIGEACATMPLVTAGSGIALGLAPNFRRQGLLPQEGVANALPPSSGWRAVIAGSCSLATQAQVAAMQKEHPAFHVDPMRLAEGGDVVKEALTWADAHLADGPVLFYATAAAKDVKQIQAQLGVDKAGQLVENALAAIAVGVVQQGVGQLIVAGGETSGAVVKALGIHGLRIGAEIDPGVPWTAAIRPQKNAKSLALALKSGNFGTPDFFLKAWSVLENKQENKR